MELPTLLCGPSKYLSQSEFPFLPALTYCSPFSIEANVVVIASCIPTLQPLLEIIFGKRVFGSYSQGKGDRYKGSDSFPPSSYNRNKHSNALGKDDLGFTNLTNVTGKDSQESILPSNGSAKQNTFSMGHIHRTDDVIVEYESSSQQGAKVNSSW
jgi:hypothetical protein